MDDLATFRMALEEAAAAEFPPPSHPDIHGTQGWHLSSRVKVWHDADANPRFALRVRLQVEVDGRRLTLPRRDAKRLSELSTDWTMQVYALEEEAMEAPTGDAAARILRDHRGSIPELYVEELRRHQDGMSF